MKAVRNATADKKTRIELSPMWFVMDEQTKEWNRELLIQLRF